MSRAWATDYFAGAGRRKIQSPFPGNNRYAALVSVESALTAPPDRFRRVYSHRPSFTATDIVSPSRQTFIFTFSPGLRGTMTSR